MKLNNIFEYTNTQISVLDVAKKFPAFYASLTKAGNDYGTKCPNGHPSKSGTSFKLVYDTNNQKNFYYCHSCTAHGGAFDLAKLLGNWTTKQTVDWFIKEWNLDDSFKQYSKHQKTPEEIIEEEKIKMRAILYEALLQEGKRLLFEPEGKEALDYLVNIRKYDPELIKLTELMYLPPQPIAKQFLRKEYPGFLPYINDLHLVTDFGDFFRIAIPFRSETGVVTGLVLRATQAEGVSGTTFSGRQYVKQRWTSTVGMQKDTLFGIHKLRNTDTVLIVEGYPDATYLPVLGYPNIVAFGQARLGNKQLKSLLQKNIKNVILGLDNDKVGPDNTAKTIKLLMENGIRVYVLDPKSLTPYKDPDEFTVVNGLEAFKNIVSASEGGELWAINYHYSIEPDTPKGKVDAYEKAIEYGMYLDNALSEQTFTELLAKKSGLPKRQITSNILKLRKTIVTSKDLKIEKKMNKDEYKSKLASSATANRIKVINELFNGKILPFQELSNLDYYIYDKDRDVMTEVTSKDKLENACKDNGILLPEVIPGLKQVFHPQTFEKIDIEGRTINLFTPTSYMYWEKNDEVIDLETQCPYIMRIIRNIVKDSDGSTAYVPRFLNWLAYGMQYRTKSNVGWVFMSKPGVGKNMMYEEIIKPFYGNHMCCMLSNNEVHSDYNARLRNKLFVVFNEISHNRNDRESLASKLKVYITEPEITTREIYGKHVVTDNHMNTVFYSNDEEVPVVIEKDDRRYCVFSSNTPLTSFPDWNYWIWSAAIAEELDYFYRHLINYDVNKIQATTCFMTKAKRDLIEASATRFEQLAGALLGCDADWINEQLETAYALRNDIFSTGRLRVTQKELDRGFGSVDWVRSIFQVIFPDTKSTANAFTRHMKMAGIEKRQVRLKDERSYIYVWKENPDLNAE